jgi:Cyclic nucleotide-binding domain
MEIGESKVRSESTDRSKAGESRDRNSARAGLREELVMRSDGSRDSVDGAASRPLAELLACPPAVANLLNDFAHCIEFDTGDTVFRQSAVCRGLYLVISGQLVRKADRVDTRLTLGSVRAGELVELAAALGDLRHTYSMIAQTSGSALLLPIDALNRAFLAYPILRMQLLQELAREVSRAYGTCCTTRIAGTRRRGV